MWVCCVESLENDARMHCSQLVFFEQGSTGGLPWLHTFSMYLNILRCGCDEKTSTDHLLE